MDHGLNRKQRTTQLWVIGHGLWTLQKTTHMRAIDLAYYLENHEELGLTDFNALEEVVQQYPFCLGLRLLTLKKAQLENLPNYERLLNLAATYTPDRKHLYKFVKTVPVKEVAMGMEEEVATANPFDLTEVLDLSPTASNYDEIEEIQPPISGFEIFPEISNIEFTPDFDFVDEKAISTEKETESKTTEAPLFDLSFENTTETPSIEIESESLNENEIEIEATDNQAPADILEAPLKKEMESAIPQVENEENPLPETEIELTTPQVENEEDSLAETKIEAAVPQVKNEEIPLPEKEIQTETVKPIDQFDSIEDLEPLSEQPFIEKNIPETTDLLTTDNFPIELPVEDTFEIDSPEEKTISEEEEILNQFLEEENQEEEKQEIEQDPFSTEGFDEFLSKLGLESSAKLQEQIEEEDESTDEFESKEEEQALEKTTKLAEDDAIILGPGEDEPQLEELIAAELSKDIPAPILEEQEEPLEIEAEEPSIENPYAEILSPDVQDGVEDTPEKTADFTEPPFVKDEIPLIEETQAVIDIKEEAAIEEIEAYEELIEETPSLELPPVDIEEQENILPVEKEPVDTLVEEEVEASKMAEEISNATIPETTVLEKEESLEAQGEPSKETPIELVEEIPTDIVEEAEPFAIPSLKEEETAGEKAAAEISFADWLKGLRPDEEAEEEAPVVEAVAQPLEEELLAVAPTPPAIANIVTQENEPLETPIAEDAPTENASTAEQQAPIVTETTEVENKEIQAPQTTIEAEDLSQLQATLETSSLIAPPGVYRLPGSEEQLPWDAEEFQQPTKKKAEKKKRKKKKKKKKKKSVDKLAKASIQENEEIISEPLANLLAIQGKTKKAIKMYQQLILKFPEKSTYFAGKLNKLRNS